MPNPNTKKKYKLELFNSSGKLMAEILYSSYRTVRYRAILWQQNNNRKAKIIKTN